MFCFSRLFQYHCTYYEAWKERFENIGESITSSCNFSEIW